MVMMMMRMMMRMMMMIMMMMMPMKIIRNFDWSRGSEWLCSMLGAYLASIEAVVQ